MTRERPLTSASKFEPNGGIFDVSPKSVRASPNVKTPSLVPDLRRNATHEASRVNRV